MQTVYHPENGAVNISVSEPQNWVAHPTAVVPFHTTWLKWPHSSKLVISGSSWPYKDGSKRGSSPLYHWLEMAPGAMEAGSRDD